LGGASNNKSTVKKKSPSKLRRAAAREQLRLKTGDGSSSGEVSESGMAPRKRKKD